MPARMPLGLVVAFLLITQPWPTAYATSMNSTPRTCVMLRTSGRIAVLTEPTKAALYEAGWDRVLQRFHADGPIRAIDVTPDERYLLVGCDNGGCGVFCLETGKRLWWFDNPGTGFLLDVSFSWSGETCAVGGGYGVVAVFETQTGRVLASIPVPGENMNILSVAVTPDGSQGVCVARPFRGGNQEIYVFDTRTAKLRKTGMGGRSPVRISSDGRYAVCPASGADSTAVVQLITLQGDLSARRVGKFSDVGRIRPTEDGGFLVTTVLGAGDRRVSRTAGMYLRPSSGQMTEIWNVPWTPDCCAETEFSETKLRGVITDCVYWSHVTDLLTGESLLQLGPSGRILVPSALQPPWAIMLSGIDAQLIAVILVVVGGGLAVLWFLCVRASRSQPVPR